MKEGIHFSNRIEKSILGMCSLFNAFGRIYGVIDAKCFYNVDNQKVFEQMAAMYDAQQPINITTLWERMVKQNITLQAGNTPWYLSTLEINITSPASLEFEAILLKDMWRRRRMMELKAMPDEGTDVQAEIFKLTKELNAIQGAEYSKEWQSMDELMFELLKHQEEVKAGTKNLITTGFKALDRENGGFSGGQLIIVGARPGVGKSALMGKMAVSIAKKQSKVGIVSLEMNNTEIAARLASLETEFDFSTIYRNLFRDENEAVRFYNIISKTTINLPIYVSTKTKVDINQIRSKAAKLKHQHGVDVLMIDYLQLVDSQGANKQYNREQEVAGISRGLKLLAMEMDIPVVVLCQLNRNVTGRSAKDRYPKLSDLRESGAIEQDADIVMMLHRDYISGYQIHTEGDKAGMSTENEADLLALKWRNGAPVHLPLDFIPQQMRFQEKSDARFIPIKPQKEEVEEDPF